MDQSHCWGERVTREGDRVVIELPGARPEQAARTKAILRAQTSLRMVDDEPARPLVDDTRTGILKD